MYNQSCNYNTLGDLQTRAWWFIERGELNIIRVLYFMWLHCHPVYIPEFAKICGLELNGKILTHPAFNRSLAEPLLRYIRTLYKRTHFFFFFLRYELFWKNTTTRLFIEKCTCKWSWTNYETPYHNFFPLKILMFVLDNRFYSYFLFA